MTPQYRNIPPLAKLGWTAAGVIALAGCANSHSQMSRYDWKASPMGSCYKVAHISPDLTRGLWFLIAPAGSYVSISITGDYQEWFRFEDNTPRPLAPMTVEKPLVLSCRLQPPRAAPAPRL